MTKKVQATIDSHILGIIQSLETDTSPFTAHDITRKLRKRINDSELEILGRAYRPLSLNGATIQTQDVDHAEVRDIVHAFFEDGKMNSTRHNNGSYWTYTPTGTVPTPASALPGALPGALPTPDPSSSGAFIHGAPAPQLNVSGVIDPPRAVTHLTGCMPFPHTSFPAPAPLPKVDPLERLIQKDVTLLRLRHKASQRYLILPSGRTVWKRKCDLTSSVNHASGVRDALKLAINSGDVEIVSV